jgi:hypothetical protein
MIKMNALPENMHVRVPTMDDLQAVFEQNLTGATRLYERAGMHVALQHDTYEKELRAGKDLRTQSISV